MSGRINYSNLSDRLKEKLNGLGLTEEQVVELIEEALVSINEKVIEQDEVVNGLVDKVGELNGLMTEEKGDLVGAINELFQSANNGKELIASAIGEPLNSGDTFSAMSNDINGLLSTFKTNMMNNGIVVESNDRFKSLIDKIANMVEEGSGKGIQFAEGVVDISDQTGIVKNQWVIPINIGFTPTIVLALVGISNSENTAVAEQPITNLSYTRYNGTKNKAYKIIEVTDSSITIGTSGTYHVLYNDLKWYAIGVGEEDTTLLDSLKSILAEEGVTTTEEDDMASLITKVDTEFTEKNNEIARLESENNELESSAEDDKTRWYNLLKLAGYNVNDTDGMDELYKALYDSCLVVGDIKQVACGFSFTYIIKNDGSLWSCGYNECGQLGLGDAGNRNAFTQVTKNINNDVKEVACGWQHAVIVKNDGSVWTCGCNNSGQLGRVNLDPYNTSIHNTFEQSTQVFNNIEHVVCGHSHTCVLGSDGSLWGCGNNEYGQLGSNVTSGYGTFTNINSNVKQVSCGYYNTFVLKNDGTVWSCGFNGTVGELGLNITGNYTDKYAFTRVTTNISNVKQISCGAHHTFIVKNDGSLWACGENGYGQIGIGSSEYGAHATFAKINTNINNDVSQVVCGDYHTFIIKNDGSLWACGENSRGQLGLGGDTNNRTTFTKVTTNINNDVKQVDGGEYYSVIVKNDTAILSTGANNVGQLGLGDNSNRNIFTRRSGFNI